MKARFAFILIMKDGISVRIYLINGEPFVWEEENKTSSSSMFCSGKNSTWVNGIADRPEIFSEEKALVLSYFRTSLF